MKSDKIETVNNFRIISHKNSKSIHASYKEFTIIISDENKKQIVRQIKNSPFFVDSGSENPKFLCEMNFGDTQQVIRDSQSRNVFVRETYVKEKGFARENDIITITKIGDTLVYIEKSD